MATEKKKIDYLKWLFVLIILGLIVALMIPSFVHNKEKELLLLESNLDQYENASDVVKGINHDSSDSVLRKMYRELMIENLELRDSPEMLKKNGCL